jgi:hypothetical protein
MASSAHSAEQQLASFIAKFTPEVASLTHCVLGKMRRRTDESICQWLRSG